MSIHVARHSSQLGVFTSEEVMAGLQSGRFLLTDLAWREGLTNWTPLGEWAEFRHAVPPAIPAMPAASAEPMPAWERGASVGNFFATIRDVALDPIRTFDALPAEGYAKPIRYAYATDFPVWLLLSLGIAVFALMIGTAEFQSLQDRTDIPSSIGRVNAGLIIVGAPILLGVFFLLAPFMHFISAGFIHLLLLPWGPQGGFPRTYRANSYVTSAFTLPQMIPCVNYVALVWQIVCLVIAQSRVHKIAWWKVSISFLFAFFSCCCLFAAIMPIFSRLTHQMR